MGRGGWGVYCCLHTLVLQYKTASASKTVIGTFSFLQFRGKSQTCMAGDRGLHDAVFYGFP